MKLHVGCGKKYLPGYVHIDVIPYEHVDIVCDTRHLKEVSCNSVEEIYACHILEHVKREDITDVLTEWNRVLKPKGVLRLSVPDFSAIVEEYQQSNDVSKLQGLLFGGQTYDYNFHHIVFDFRYLKATLEKCGYFRIERYDWCDFLPQDYDDFSRAYIPHMDFENGRLMSLNIVAVKGNQ